MKLVFFGSPQFAVPSLEAIYSSGHEISVITQPNKPKGRKLVMTPTPVKVLARAKGLPVMTPADLNDEKFIDDYKSLKPQVNVVIAYGRIMPAWLIDHPRFGSINAHASLLPRWRGAAPIRRALMAGDVETGVTIQRVVEELDAGDIALQRKISVAKEDNNQTLSGKLAKLSAKMLVEALDLIKISKLPKIKQDQSQVTLAVKINKEEQKLDLTLKARDLFNNIRALAPKPAAYIMLNGKRLKVLKAKVVEEAGKPGQVIEVSKQGVVVGTGDKALLLVEMQPEGGRAMSAFEFAKGHKLI